MKHIKTTSEEESKAKKEYSGVEPGETLVADEKIEATARELVKILQEIDEKTLEASKLRGALMSYMKRSENLKSKNGTLLCTWTAGNVSNTVDYKGILAHYKVKVEDSVLKQFTKTSQGSRRFSLEID